MRKIMAALLVLALVFLYATPALAGEGTTQPGLTAYYAGPSGGVLTALTLTDSLTRVEDPAQAEVLVLNGVIPNPQSTRSLVENGAGLLLILGPDITADQLQTLFGEPIALTQYNTALSLVAAPEANDPLLKSVTWNSSPQVRERFAMTMANPAFQPLINGFEDGELLLGHMLLGKGQVYVMTAFLDGFNPQFQSWAYFNYLVYYLAERAAGETPLTFASYPGSPVPHSGEQIALFGLLALMLGTAVLAFWLVRRYSLAHPEALDRLVTRPIEFAEKQATSDWNEIGFHRPLGGFLLALMFGLVLFIPLIIYQNMILPVYILPSAQALGIWGRVVQFFQFLWLFFDMGTSIAFIKFFAERRIQSPREAIKYAQVFVWWQALSGAIQVAMVTAVAGTVLPHTVYALYAWSVIIHTLIQVPGFYQVMRHALMAWQRFDYAQLLEMGGQVVFPIITQPIFVTIMVIWSRSHPVFGPAMGGLLGLGLAAYASEAMMLGLGYWLYRRAGYNAGVLFMAHFDWQTVKNAFRFGVYEMLGSVAWAVGQAMEILVTQSRLINYTEIWGNWMLAQNFVFAFNVVATLYNGVMPAISESISNARIKLSQYYAAMSYKWGGLVSAFIGSVLLAVADRFILGASGPEFVRAAAYSVPLVIWGAIQYPSWVGDNVQLGSNRPYLKTALVAGEQTIRIVLALLLMRRFQINALIIAYFVGLLSKDIVAYFVNHRTCYPQKFYFWQSLGAPLLAGAAHWAVVRFVTGFIWQGDPVTSILIFLIGILFSFPLFAFFYGLFGGWDDDTLAELKHAARLSSFMAPLARLFWAASALGARFSPLHGRFPIAIRAEALAEAQSLEAERVELVQPAIVAVI